MGIENPVHLLFIGAVALLVLGPKRLPEMARALGKGVREFREAMRIGAEDEPPPPPPVAPEISAPAPPAPPVPADGAGHDAPTP